MGRNNGIDLLRLVGAFFIVLIHSQFGSTSFFVSGNIKLLARWAVPFYFIVSGYFIGIKYNKTNSVNLEDIKKLVGIYLVANLIYLPIIIAKNKLLKENIPSNVELFLYGSYWHLWYVSSLIIGIITLWYFISSKQFFILKILSIFIIVFVLFSNSYSLIFHINPSIDFGRFLLSIPFLYVGFLVSKYNLRIKGGFWISILLILVGILGQFFEASFFSARYNLSVLDQNFLLGTIPAAVGAFLLSQNLPRENEYLAIKGKEFSLFIYIYHPLIIFLVNRVLEQSTFNFLIFSPIITFLLALLTGMFLKKYMPVLYDFLNGALFKKNTN